MTPTASTATRGREPLLAGLAALAVAGALAAGFAIRRVVLARQAPRARIQARIDAIAGPATPAQEAAMTA